MHIQQLEAGLQGGPGVLSMIAGNSGKLILKVLDAQGRIAKTVVEMIEEGAHRLMINLNDLTEGAYVLNAFYNDSFVNAFRFIKT
jgi:hypothetical protein